MQKPNVFVTVGSTDFDALVQTVDALVPSLQADGVMQIGHGRYLPANWPHFRFAPTLDPYYEKATLVIAHGGLGTTIEVLTRGLPLVSVSNPDRYDNHQEDLLEAMAQEGYLVWCRQLEELEQAIETAQTTPLQRYEPSECEIHLVISDFLSDCAKSSR
jgi:UDP-N-acetylglucosamine transferase subunit ALG13